MAYIRHRKDEAPTRRPTFDTKGRQVERIVPPGDRFTTLAAGGGMQTHACKDCRALYTELTGIELEPA